jgi:hypothetical protein
MPPIQAPKSIQRPTAFQYFVRTTDLYMIAAFTTLDVSYWPTPSVAATRPVRKLPGDKLPSAENAHDGRR